MRRVPARSQAGQPSQRHSSLCPPAPPSGLPWEPSSQSPSAPLPLPGSRLPAGGERNRPLLLTSVSRHKPLQVSAVTAEGPTRCVQQHRVGGLTVAVVTWVSSPRGAPCPGLPGHGLVTRQCLGHQVPGEPGRPARGPVGTPRAAPLSPVRSAPGALSGARGLWPHLAVCPGRPSRPRTSRWRYIRGTFWSFFSCSIFPVLTMILLGSASGAGKGHTDTQRVLLPWGVSLVPLTPNSPVPHTRHHRDAALCPASPSLQLPGEVGQRPLLRERQGPCPRTPPAGSEGPLCSVVPGGSGLCREAGPAHQGGGASEPST